MNDIVELRRILTVALRWWWLLMIVGALGVGAGYFYTQSQTPIYRATTTLVVGQSIQSMTLDSRAITAGEQLALTYANIVRLQPVMEAVVTQLDLPYSWQSLAQDISATPVDSTQLLRISANATSIEEAIAIADAVATTLIQLSPTTLQNQALDEDQNFTQQRLETLRKNISDGQSRIDELESQIPGASSVQALQQIQRDIDTVQSLVTGWENNYSRLLDFSNQTASPNFLSVVEPAQANSTPIYPVPLVNMLAVALVAVALTFGILVLREFMTEVPLAMEESLSRLGLALLGAVGTFKGNKLSERLIIKHNLLSSVSEDYRLLRSKIQYMSARWQRKILLVTGTAEEEPQSIVTANLGIVMAQAGLKTIIIDTNLRHPSQHELFELSNEQGLADTLHAMDEDCSAFLQETSVHNLRVLTAGSLPTLYPTELLSSERMQKLLDRLSVQADIILCQSAEIIHFADTMVLSSRVDGVILVLDGNNKAPAISQTIMDLKQAGANLLGVVVQSMKASTAMPGKSGSGTSMRTNLAQFSMPGNGNPVSADYTAANYTNGKAERVRRSKDNSS